MTKMKPNPRRQELKEALTKAQGKSGEIPGIFTAASTAMTSKAWTGGTSGDFTSGLTECSTKAKKGGTDSVEEVQTAYNNCPAEIEDTSTPGPGPGGGHRQEPI